MHNLNVMRGLRLAAGAALLMAATVSHAQFVWVDAKGTKQFSDRPPPPGTPQKNILKGPKIATATDPAAVATTPSAAPKEAPPSIAEREADYRKRKTEQADTDKRAGIDAENARNKSIACASARDNKAALEGGKRIRDSNAERSWLDDKQIAERKGAAQKVIDEHCS